MARGVLFEIRLGLGPDSRVVDAPVQDVEFASPERLQQWSRGGVAHISHLASKLLERLTQRESRPRAVGLGRKLPGLGRHREPCRDHDPSCRRQRLRGRHELIATPKGSNVPVARISQDQRLEGSQSPKRCRVVRY